MISDLINAHQFNHKDSALYVRKNVLLAAKCNVHLLFKPPPTFRPLSVSYRGVCGATACMDAAAIRFLGSRSPGN